MAKVKSTVDFLKQIRETGYYKTATKDLGKPRKNGFWTSLIYNIKGTFVAMNEASKSAKAGTFTDQSWADCASHLMWETERFGTEVICEGFAERAAYKGPVIYVCNHMSLYETFAFPAIALAFTPMAIVLKESLLHVPILGNTFKCKPTIPLGRKNPREDLKLVMELGQKNIDEGNSILLYPQGHRIPYFKTSDFNSMGVKLALKTGAPVVPIANQTKFLGVGKYTHDFGPVDVDCPVRIACGPVLKVTRENQKEVHQQCVDFIAGKLEDWGCVEVIRE